MQFVCLYLTCLYSSQVHQWVPLLGVLRDVDDDGCHAYWNTSCCHLHSAEENISDYRFTAYDAKKVTNNLCLDEEQLLSVLGLSPQESESVLQSHFGSLCFTSWKNLNIYNFNW